MLYIAIGLTFSTVTRALSAHEYYISSYTWCMEWRSREYDPLERDFHSDRMERALSMN